MNKRRQVFQMDGFEITIQLPKDYGKQKVKRYAALIVHDGDMLFKRCNKDMIFIGILSKERTKTLHRGRQKLAQDLIKAKRLGISLG